jgi:predicted metal-dependent peptidase
MPGEIKEAINDNYATDVAIVPWEVVLKDFLASSSENVLDYTMKSRSKRFDTRPGTKKEDVLNVAIGIDTSGSIDNEMLKVFFNELYWIEKTGTKMTVFEWDTKVNREYDFRDYDNAVSGRGGTDPTDFLETVSDRKFDCIITFTDLCFAPVKEKYNIPMLWVVDNGGYDWYGDDNYPVEEGIIMKVNKSRDGFEVVRK